MKNWGIKTRILFLALVPFSLIVTLISLHFIVTRIDDLDQALQERGKAIARQLAPACEYGVFSGNREFLSRLARSALWEKDIRTVSIADAEGNILAHASHGTQIERVWPVVGRTPPVYTFKSPIFQSEVRIDDLSEVSREGYAGTPAARDRQPIGMVSIDISGSSTILQQNRALGESLLIMMLGLIFTALVALRMARGVIRPIQSLTSAMTRIKSGDLDQRVAEESGGELGSLEKGINAMAETLERSKKMEKKMADDALYLEKIRAQVTLESIGDGVITTDDKGKVVYMNPVASEFTGWDIRTAEGLLLKDIFKTVDEMSSAPREYPLHLCLRDGNIIRHDSHHLLVRKDGYRFAIQDSAAPIRDRDGKIIGAALVFHDMTELQHMARRMAYLASHDPLTGLINRREFESRLQQVLDSARLEGRQHAICYLDLDQFKIVNDTCGHVAGDELLKQLAQHLHNEIRQSDVLARLGGDEFGVILENCSVEMAQQVAELLRQSIKSFRFAWQDR